MQAFDRATEPPPVGLQTPDVQNSRKAMREFMLFGDQKRGQTSVPRSSGNVLTEPGVIEALVRLFQGRCAFCEAQAPLGAHRMRPPAEALPFQQSEQGHLYYAWLADAWENLYAICESCRPSEPNYFPVTGKRAPLPDPEALNRYVDEGLGLWRAYPLREKPLILDPCGSNDFYRSLRAEWSGTLTALSDRGQATITAFNLNRPERTDLRRARYTEYFDDLVAALTGSNGGRRITELIDFPALEFGGTWYIVLRRLAQWIGSDRGPKPVLSPSRVVRVYSALYGQPGAEARLRSALARLREEDAKGPQAEPVPSPPRPGHARIASVEFENFKSIERMSLVMPAPVDPVATKDHSAPVPSLLILGENAAGKSSLLEGIALALSDKPARDKLGLAAESYILDPTYLGATKVGAKRKATISITLTDKSIRKLTISDNEMTAKSGAEFELMPVFAYGAFRHYQHKQRSYAADRTVRNLFDGSILGNPQAWLLGLNDGRFAMVIRALREILSIEGEFEVVEREPVSGRCFVVTSVQDRQGMLTLSRTPLSAVSSGFRSILAMTCDIMQGLMDNRIYNGFETLITARGVVLIDEIEAHLHPRWKMQVMSGLRRALPSITFIATTHDPLCLRGMVSNEVVVLQRVASKENQAQTKLPVFVEQLVDLPDFSQLRIEQLLTSDFFQLFSTDAPEIDDQFARVGDLLVKQRQGEALSPAERITLSEFKRDVAEAMPIGTSEAHRLVQEAVAKYLKERRTASDARLRRLRQNTKQRILSVLRST